MAGQVVTESDPIPSLRLLVVDGDPTVAKDIEAALRESTLGDGLTCHRVERLAEAMARIRSSHYDAILIDTEVLDLPSSDAIKQLRNTFSYDPIIALSKSQDDGLALEWVRAGADDCLYTGVLNERILGRVVRYAIERASTYQTQHQRSQTRHILNALLRLSLQELPLEELLLRSLDIIISAPFTAILRMGGILLADESQQMLKLVARLNLPVDTLETSNEIAMGHCLCGKAVSSQDLVHVDYAPVPLAGEANVDMPQGHYCIPIVSRGSSLGVIVLYMEAGHRAQQSELEFLEGVADTLAGLIERTRAQQRLIRVHQLNSRLLSAVTSILVGVDDLDQISHWNGAAERCFGMRTEEVLGRPILQSGIDWDWAEVSRNVLKCLSGMSPSRRFEVRFRPRDGHSGLLSVMVTPFSANDRSVGGYLLIAEDVTDQKSEESRLMQAQKLQSIGQLAAGIAHEINTPIQYVRDNLRFLQDSFAEMRPLLELYQRIASGFRNGAPLEDLVATLVQTAEQADIDFCLAETPDAIGQSLEGVERVTAIVRAMKDFSHPGSEEKAPVDINRAIRSTVTISRNEWKYVADVELDLDPELPATPCLAGPLNEVILNILVNAAHAVGESLEGRPEQKGLIRIMTRRNGKWVELRIADDGTGIPEQARPYVFDPFFTTKEVGRGTGQGLAICHHIVVEKHGGEIGFETEIGHGTSFIVRLPMEVHDDEE